MSGRIDRPRELYLVAYDIWLPNLSTPNGERRVKTMIKRSLSSADRQLRHMKEWPYDTHLLALLRTEAAWEPISADDLSARAKEQRDARSNEPSGWEGPDPEYEDD